LDAGSFSKIFQYMFFAVFPRLAGKVSIFLFSSFSLTCIWSLAGAATINYKSTQCVQSEDQDSSLPKLNEISARAQRQLAAAYPELKEVRWYRIKGGYTAIFTNTGIHTTVVYDQSGEWIHTLKTYQEAQMSAMLRAKVKSVYFDYAITWIYETINADGTSFQVNVMDDRRLVTLFISADGEMEIAGDYLRG
jgi:hypothetical protein